ncbi:thiamine pyrophosphate-dependent enzyme [Psychrobacter aquimaris]|uniref:hypothetical protein n=1 Tax=Psychrobacter aquimaris TaxID=292733 RepID=UPI0018DF9D16|nr:hypothetical protein [Psychrobacter aquimaris]
MSGLDLPHIGFVQLAKSMGYEGTLIKAYLPKAIDEAVNTSDFYLLEIIGPNTSEI